MPICMDQAMRSLLLKEMPTLDDIDIAARQGGDQSHSKHIPRTDATGSPMGANTAAGSGKGKEKIAPSGSAPKVGSRSMPSDTEASSEETVPLQSRKRLLCSDGSTIGRPPLMGQQVSKKATAP
jgi:hypothetical protein